MTRTQAIEKLKRVEEEVKLFRQSLEESTSADTEHSGVQGYVDIGHRRPSALFIHLKLKEVL